MCVFEFINLQEMYFQFRRIGLTCQDCRTQHATTAMQNPSTEIGQGSALPNEIINQKVVSSCFNRSFESCLLGKSREAICLRMAENVCLYDLMLDIPTETLPEQFSYRFRNGIYPFAFGATPASPFPGA